MNLAAGKRLSKSRLSIWINLEECKLDRDERDRFGMGGMGRINLRDLFGGEVEEMSPQMMREVGGLLGQILGGGIPGMMSRGMPDGMIVITSDVRRSGKHPGKHMCTACGRMHGEAAESDGKIVEGCPLCGSVAPTQPHLITGSALESSVLKQLVESPPKSLKSITCDKQAGVNQGGHPYSKETIKLEFRGEP